MQEAEMDPVRAWELKQIELLGEAGFLLSRLALSMEREPIKPVAFVGNFESAVKSWLDKYEELKVPPLESTKVEQAISSLLEFDVKKGEGSPRTKASRLIDAEYEALVGYSKRDLFDYLSGVIPEITKEVSDELHDMYF